MAFKWTVSDNIIITAECDVHGLIFLVAYVYVCLYCSDSIFWKLLPRNSVFGTPVRLHNN